ncbi:uncharacterized protein TNCV_3918041 [Trichonephila clavipes]|nr:uncharacterized protein TNCV_3918041 [Trichonephila clavipes]
MVFRFTLSRGYGHRLVVSKSLGAAVPLNLLFSNVGVVSSTPSLGEFFCSKSALVRGLSIRAVSPLVRLVEDEERWEAPDLPQGVLPQNWGETELNRSVTCMVLKTTAKDRCHLALCHDEFRAP